jgi:hypothetical protein
MPNQKKAQIILITLITTMVLMILAVVHYSFRNKPEEVILFTVSAALLLSIVLILVARITLKPPELIDELNKPMKKPRVSNIKRADLRRKSKARNVLNKHVN